ncbi:hypothetical protein L0156_16065 [bacterium]|nr:hypothetical protein [bacterium]
MPSARDPWAILDQTPGVDMDRFNVGGTESGQQSGFTARGGNTTNSIWYYDGVDISDLVAGNASSLYYDFDVIEEISIATTARDVNVPTGGTVVNIVSRRPANAFHANGSFYFTNNSADNYPLESRAIDLRELRDYGIDAGGSLWKDHLSIWGAYRKNNTLAFTGDIGDTTDLDSVSWKTYFLPRTTHQLSFHYFNSDKTKTARSSSPTQQLDPATLWKQENTDTILPGFWMGQHLWTPSADFLLTTRFSYIGNGFSLVPGGGNVVPIIYLEKIRRYEDNFYYSDPIDRRSNLFHADASVFKEKWKGDHEFKFGFEYRKFDFHSYSSYGNGVLLVDYLQTTHGGPLTEGYAKIQRPLNGRGQIDRTSLYASDTLKFHRFVATVGFHLDHQTGKNLASDIPTVSGFEDFLGPVIQFAGNKPGIRFDDFSPRLGIVYDLNGNGKTLLRGNFARYYDAFGASFLNYANPALTASGLIFGYENRNGDRSITRDEITLCCYLYGNNHTIIDGPSYGGPEIDLVNPHTTEWLAGIEREITEDISVEVLYSHRTYGNLPAVLPQGITSDDFIPAGVFHADTPLGEFNVPYHDLPFQHDGSTILTNIQGYEQVYNGVDFLVRKEWKDRFQLRGGLALQKQKANYELDSALGFILRDGGLSGSVLPFDPTNIPFLADQTYAYSTGGSGKTGIYPFSEWQLKISGVYELPWSSQIAAFLRYQQGYPHVLFGSVRSDNLILFTGSPNHLILLEPVGSRRYDNLLTLDLRFEKSLGMRQLGRITFMGDVFNVTNANTVLQRDRLVTSSTFNRVEEALAGRLFRFGFRLSL